MIRSKNKATHQKFCQLHLVSEFCSTVKSSGINNVNRYRKHKKLSSVKSRFLGGHVTINLQEEGKHSAFPICLFKALVTSTCILFLSQLKPSKLSGYYVYRNVEHTKLVCSAHTVCCVWISHQTAIISRYIIN